MHDDLDYPGFHALLLQATRQVFSSVRRDHPDETFYAFGLFHEPLWGYIAPTANTEEGLIRQAHEYQLDKHHLGYAQKSIEELADELRWIPGDWAYHSAGEEFFQPVENWLSENDIYWKSEDDDIKHDEMDGRMIAICRAVLRTLDDEGLFGVGAVRERVVVNILMGDQDGTYLDHGQALNPPQTFKRWLSELKRAQLIVDEEAALNWLKQYSRRSGPADQ